MNEKIPKELQELSALVENSKEELKQVENYYGLGKLLMQAPLDRNERRFIRNSNNILEQDIEYKRKKQKKFDRILNIAEGINRAKEKGKEYLEQVLKEYQREIEKISKQAERSSSLSLKRKSKLEKLEADFFYYLSDDKKIPEDIALEIAINPRKDLYRQYDLLKEKYLP